MTSTSAPRGSVVVLGASYPWSRPLVEGLSRSGFAVHVVDRSSPSLQALADLPAPSSGAVRAVPLDLTDLDALMGLAGAWSDLPAPVALIHTVPPPVPGSLAGRDVPGIADEVHRGFTSMVVATRSLLPLWLKAGHGLLVAVGSPAARAPFAKATVHSAVAGAVPRFLKAVDRESHRSGVHTTYVEPVGLGSPPVGLEVPEEEGELHGDHRQYYLPPTSVAVGVVSVLRGPLRHRVRLKGPHRRAAPSFTSLRRYAEREFHDMDPEPDEVRSGSSRSRSVERTGRIFVVTGASRGIGQASALAVAARGRRFVLTGRDVGGLEATAKGLRERGAEAGLVPLDLNEPTAADALCRATEAAWGVPYLLLNNAGLGTIRRLENQTLADIRQQIVVNLLAPILITRAFLPAMLAAGRGRLLYTGSSAAAVPVPRMSVYAGTKGGLNGFGLALDRELHHRGLRVSVLQPITVDTDFISSARAPGAKDFRDRAWWQAMTLTPERVGEAALKTARRPRPVVFVPPSARWLAGALDALGPVGERMLRLAPASPRAASSSGGRPATP